MKFKKGDIIVDDWDQVYILHDDFEPAYQSFGFKKLSKKDKKLEIRDEYTYISYTALFSLYRYKKNKPPKHIYFAEPGAHTFTLGRSFHLANKHIIRMLNELLDKHPEYQKWLWPQDSSDWKNDVDWDSFHKMTHGE